MEWFLETIYHSYFFNNLTIIFSFFFFTFHLDLYPPLFVFAKYNICCAYEGPKDNWNQ